MKSFLLHWGIAVAAVILFFILSGCVATIFPEGSGATLEKSAATECREHFGVDHIFIDHVSGSTAMNGENPDMPEYSTICRDGYQINNL